MEGWRPSLIVAIDFGMTCTAIAWSAEPEWSGPWWIQRWPRPPQANQGQLDNKVVTAVGYDDDNRLVNWGFFCTADGKAITLEKEFKLYIDPAFPDTNPNRPTHDEAVEFYTDYMTRLREYIDTFFTDTVPDYRQRNVEYLFSIPTTWQNPMITAKLEQVLYTAGFSNGYNRRLQIYLTEAEAAAVNAAKQTFKVGDIVMVADAGGATTDINVLEITERSARNTKLRALTKAEGINVGSTLIDEAVRRAISARLRALGVPGDDKELHWHADDMMREKRFEGIKISFTGEPYQIALNNIFTIPPGVAPHVQDRRVTLRGAELKQFFDSQINMMSEKIQEQRTSLTRELPHGTVRYLVLSGGLGSSQYVQRELRARYAGLEVLCAPNPQLAVANGLVADRVQTLKEGVGVYTGKCSRVSYGVLCRMPYDKRIHIGEPVDDDPLDGKKWATGQIDWLIKESQAVPDAGFSRPYQIKLPRGRRRDQSLTFETQFVMSDAPARDLPRSLKRGYVERLCKVVATFRDDEVLKVKRSWVPGRQDHIIGEFKLKTIVGSTSLKFEITAPDGTLYSQNAASVAVEWHEAAAPPEPPPLANPREPYRPYD